MDSDEDPREQTASPASPLSDEIREAIAARLEKLWERYTDALNQFITLNLSVIGGLAAAVSFLQNLQGETPNHLESKRLLIAGLVLLMFSLICEVGLRIWAQLFMEYEILQPKEEVEKYFEGLLPYTKSYRLDPAQYAWQRVVARVITGVAPFCFLLGLSLSLIFLYRNLR